MFKLFKREVPATRPPSRPAPAKVAASPAAIAPARPRPVARSPLAAPPAPMVEVREDHDESAWDLWEQSNFQLDSQMGGLSPSDSVRVRDARPSQAAELDDDPFSRIGKNDR